MTSTQARARPGPFGNTTSSSNNASNKGFGSGFGSGSGAWNEGIWSGKAIGSGMKGGIQDTGRAQSQSSPRWVPVKRDADRFEDGLQVSTGNSGTITGSGSLLSSSESEGFNLRQGSWKSVDDPSPGLSRVHTNGSSTSPMHHQNSNQLIPHPFNENNSANSTYFSMTPTSTNISSRPSQKNFLDPTSGSLVTGAFDSNSLSRVSRHNSDEESRFAARKMAFEGTDTGLAMQSARPSLNNNNVSGYNSSSAASRSGSMPPSRGDVDPSTRYSNDNPQYSRYNASASHRQNLSAQAPAYTMPAKATVQKYPDQFSPSQLSQLLGEFGNLNVGKEARNGYTTQSEASYGMPSGYVNGYAQDHLLDGNEIWKKEDIGYQAQQEQFSPTGSGSGSLNSQQGARRGINFSGQYSQSSSVSDARLGHSPYYTTTGTPPTYQQRAPSRGGFSNGTLVTGQAALLERRLRGLQQEQAYMMPRGAQMHFSNQIPHPSAYDFHPQPGFRMNQVNSYYPMPPFSHQMAAQHIPRGPAREHDVVQPVRSTLLEEFRNNSKTNKRYELKASTIFQPGLVHLLTSIQDIYNYIVEFSGDQHGSRFIQQKLETANSDEKDQVFRELFPNAIQLMTDVFGNYVIQKFFEHGNQSQKKILANQMRTHILTLSTQMYGCRVVQKALEHILTDQQAQLVRELEHNVLKCVKDQNGNHVVQKAIERVPAEHIQFILNAFTGQVQGLATHPYGCRVIQRMLEHCEEPTQTAVLREIHASASSLILDQFGNYVAQHIIEHGRDEDRTKLVSLVISQLSIFSKHKFASNVVEKSIQFGSKEERDQIVATLTAVNDKGESPSQSLIRDQYGNYVIQKLLNELKDSERDEFVELIKAQLALLKRFSYGKQIAAIEKIIYTAPYPPQQFTPNGLPPPIIDTSAASTPPLMIDVTQYSQNSSLPSTHASSVIGPDGSRKSSGSNEVEVMTPTST